MLGGTTTVGSAASLGGGLRMTAAGGVNCALKEKRGSRPLEAGRGVRWAPPPPPAPRFLGRGRKRYFVRRDAFERNELDYAFGLPFDRLPGEGQGHQKEHGGV